MSNAQPVTPEAAARLLDIQDADQRIAYAKQLGVENVIPTLPHSPCLKIRKTGVVLPWNELLAEQGTLVECCDENGNTDPEVWGPLVKNTDMTNSEAHQMAQSIIVNQAKSMSDTHRVAGAVELAPRQYPDNVVPYSDILDNDTADAIRAIRELV